MARVILKFFDDEGFVPLSEDSTMQTLVTATKLAANETWKLVGDLLLDDKFRAYAVLVSLRGWFGQAISPEELISWAKAHQPKGPGIVAELINVKGPQLPELARQLIVNFPEDRRIRAAIAGNLWSGFSIGPYSNRLTNDLQIVKGWAEDPIRRFVGLRRKSSKDWRPRLRNKRSENKKEEGAM